MGAVFKPRRKVRQMNHGFTGLLINPGMFVAPKKCSYHPDVRTTVCSYHRGRAALQGRVSCLKSVWASAPVAVLVTASDSFRQTVQPLSDTFDAPTEIVGTCPTVLFSAA